MKMKLILLKASKSNQIIQKYSNIFKEENINKISLSEKSIIIIDQEN